VYEKCFQENILEVKNYLLRLNLVQTTFNSKIQFGPNWLNDIRIRIIRKDFLVNINSAIDPSAYKEISTKNYWINNNLEIWNCLTVLLGLKAESDYTPTNIISNRMYKNSIFVKY
jgi:hypothetical protein